MNAPSEKPFPWKCGYCRERAVVRVPVSYTTETTHDGRSMTVTIHDLAVPTCQKCGEMVLDDAANRRITDAIREQAGLLSPIQVRRGRESLGLTPEAFAEQLRVPVDAVATWETGRMLPPRAVDLLMRVFFGFAEVRSALADEDRLRTLGEAAA